VGTTVTSIGQSVPDAPVVGGNHGGRRRQQYSSAGLQIAGVLLMLCIWEAVSRTEVLTSSDQLPPATVAIGELVDLLGQSSFWIAVRQTLAGAGIGLGLAVAFAIPLGLLVGSSTMVWRALRPSIEFLRPVPGVALIPVAILLWGQSTQSDVALVAFGTTWLMLVQTIYGARATDELTLQTARSFGVGPLGRVRWVLLPSALPYIATGLRICSAAALIVAVTAELVIGTPGIGNLLGEAQRGVQYERMYGLVLAAGLLGIAVHLLFVSLERRFLKWHESQRREVGA
jgi:ABC-type nitrate/sulfonate/bicarbonate transport system permease component